MDHSFYKTAMAHFHAHRLNIDVDSILDCWVASRGKGPDEPPSEHPVEAFTSYSVLGERKVEKFNSTYGEYLASVKVFAERLKHPAFDLIEAEGS